MEQMEELRNYIRNVLLNIRKEQKKNLKLELKEERALRKLVRKMLLEVKETSPHELTGINVLEKLLGNIMPVIETGYKSLTTDPKQRDSYGAHILRAVQNLLSIPSMYFNLDSKTGMKTNVEPSDSMENSPEQIEEQEGEIKIKTKKNDKDSEEDKFIDINKEEKPEEKPAPDPMKAFQPIEGEDHTGRSFALETFKKVQKQVLESYSTLSNPKDREVFEEYLITNIKLYLKRFEEELSDKPPVPTTPSYEAAVSKMDTQTNNSGDVSQEPEGVPEQPEEEVEGA